MNDEPPCDECPKPKILLLENELAITIWRLCAYHSRPVAGMGGIMPLPISEIKIACDIYDATFKDFEKVLKIEQTVFPLLQEKLKTSSKTPEDTPKPSRRRGK